MEDGHDGAELEDAALAREEDDGADAISGRLASASSSPRPSPLPRAAPEGAHRGSPSRSFSASGAGSGPSSASASGARERRERERGSAGSLRRAWRTTQLCVSSLLERKLRLAYWSSVGGRFRYPKHRLGRKYAFGARRWRQS